MFFGKSFGKKPNKIETRPLSGFLELLPEDQILFESIKTKIKDVYESFGFLPLETPIIEREEVLLAKVGGDTEKEIYRLKKGENNLALRFDLTVPLARYVSENYNKLVFPFKRYQIGKVYRGERPQRGRYRELYQCDVDIIGDEILDIKNEAEIVNLIYSILKKLNVGPFVIRLSNRKILIGLIQSFGLSDRELEILRIIDKKKKISKDEMVDLLMKEKLSKDQIQIIIDLLDKDLSNNNLVEQLSDLKIDNETFQLGVRELSSIIQLVNQMQIPAENYEVDLSIVRGLDYYTGTVYETFLTEDPDLGSVCSGGRYDNLAEKYGNKKLPGVGVTIGLSRFFVTLKERGIFVPEKKVITEVLIIPLCDKFAEIGRVSKLLRAEKIKTEIYWEEVSMKKKLNYANKQKIPYVILMGENEIQSQKVTLKNMNSGEQITDDINEIIKKIKE